MLRKIVLIILLFVVLFTAGYVLFVKHVPYSEGVRTGELIKFSNKGYVFKTYEGEISQGISGAMIFKFSFEIIKNRLKHLQNPWQINNSPSGKCCHCCKKH